MARPAISVFRALADPTRLRIVALVQQMELAVGELADVLGQSQPRVSRHVKILAEAGLVHRVKEGAWVFLRASSEQHAAPLTALLDALRPDSAATEADLARLKRVRADRAEAAQAWFAAHAVQWDCLRSLHVPEAEVERAILSVLADRPIGRLLDVGTGTGRMIELLAPVARSVLGIDRSPEMLRLARAKIADLPNAELRQADMAVLPLADSTADTVMLHQVLHFAGNPPAVLAECARVLAPGGRMVIVDFAPHQREDLRTNQGHARLGFSEDVIVGWLNAAGLEGSTVGHLPGGELTVTLWRGDRAAQPLRAVA